MENYSNGLEKSINVHQKAVDRKIDKRQSYPKAIEKQVSSKAIVNPSKLPENKVRPSFTKHTSSKSNTGLYVQKNVDIKHSYAEISNVPTSSIKGSLNDLSLINHHSMTNSFSMSNRLKTSEAQQAKSIRGRSLTRKTSIQEKQKAPQNNRSQMSITANYNVEEYQSPNINRENNTIKGSPTKYSPKKVDVSYQSPSKLRAFGNGGIKKQRHSKSPEVKHNQHHSNNPSTNTSQFSSREQTPKAPNYFRHTTKEDRPEDSSNQGERKPSIANSGTKTGKYTYC